MIPDILLQEILRRRSILFIGAGFSLNAELPDGGKMPNWNGLMKKISADLENSIDDPLQVASEYTERFGKNNLIKKMADLLHVLDAKPGRVHKKLTKINDFDTIVTTNFEHLLEKAYHVENKPVQVIIGDTNISMYSPSTQTNIIKIHGDFTNIPEIVVTKKDYDDFLNKHPVLATNLSSWFSTKTPLFIGYSLNDPHFQQIRRILRDRLGEFMNKGFIVKFDASEEEIAEYKKDNLYVINLKTNGKTREESLLEFLCQIQDYVTTKKADEISLTTEEMEEVTDKIAQDITKDHLVGKIVNTISSFEKQLRDALEKFGLKQSELKKPFAYLIKLGLSNGILTTSDIGELSRIREIRNSLVHTKYIPTLSEVEYIENVVDGISTRISKIQPIKVEKPIQIEIFTDKSSYKDGDLLQVMGTLSKVIPNMPVTSMITGPENHVVSVNQTNPKNDGKFEFSIMVGGPLWEKTGKYTITAKYQGTEKDAVKEIEYQKQEMILRDSISLKINNEEFVIPYHLSDGSVHQVIATIGTNLLGFQISSHFDGKFLTRLPRKLLDSKFEGVDLKFIVFCDGEEVNVTEKPFKLEREIIIPILRNTKDVLVVGTTSIGKFKTEKQKENVIEILEGSSIPREDEKYLKPQTLIIKKGQTVRWENHDSAAHTVTSGTPEKGPDDFFDSSMFMSGGSFERKFEEKGVYRYFCLVHPWKEGKVIVTES